MLVKEFPKQFVIERFTQEKEKMEAICNKIDLDITEYQNLNWFGRLFKRHPKNKFFAERYVSGKRARMCRVMLADISSNESDTVLIHLDDTYRKLLI